MFLASAVILLVTLIGPLRHYFTRPDDVLFTLAIPIVQGLVYAALLLVLAVALRRRLRAAWLMLVVWWLLVPEIGRVLAIVDGGGVLFVIGLALVAGVLVLAFRARKQFGARRVPGSAPAAFAVSSSAA